MKTDKELTDLLRTELRKNNVNTSSKSYEWYEGEPLLLGNPFKPSENEAMAIRQIQTIIEGQRFWNTFSPK